MSVRFCLVTLLVLALFAIWDILGRPSHTQPLRSEHSQPAPVPARQEVAVTANGKLFHKPNCRYIHGQPQMLSVKEAEQKGYTPDPRCMKETFREKVK